VKFALTYDGSMPPSANKSKNQAKWDIRKALDPQLKDLWASHPALREIERDGRFFPTTGQAGLAQRHHQHPGPASHSHLVKSNASRRPILPSSIFAQLLTSMVRGSGLW
jgi:hypothetical protein